MCPKLCGIDSRGWRHSEEKNQWVLPWSGKYPVGEDFQDPPVEQSSWSFKVIHFPDSAFLWQEKCKLSTFLASSVSEVWEQPCSLCTWLSSYKTLAKSYNGVCVCVCVCTHVHTSVSLPRTACTNPRWHHENPEICIICERLMWVGKAMAA